MEEKVSHLGQKRKGHSILLKNGSISPRPCYRCNDNQSSPGWFLSEIRSLKKGMGNCMDSRKGKEESKTMEIGGKEVKFVNDVENKGKGIRVKMVLTKEELQWLMLQLRNGSESGATRIEDVLAEIEKGRKRGVVDQGWKPSLDCISEIPEVFEMNK